MSWMGFQRLLQVSTEGATLDSLVSESIRTRHRGSNGLTCFRKDFADGIDPKAHENMLQCYNEIK